MLKAWFPVYCKNYVLLYFSSSLSKVSIYVFSQWIHGKTLVCKTGILSGSIWLTQKFKIFDHPGDVYSKTAMVTSEQCVKTLESQK